MTNKIILLCLLLVSAQTLLSANINAADLELTGTLNGYYYSAEDIYTEGTTTINQGSAVTLSTLNTVTFNPGFHVVLGGTLSINKEDSDADGLLDTWEILYFGNLNQGPDDDYDNDGLTNLEEFQLGTNPSDPDTDNDEMADGWEIDNGLNPFQDDSDGDLDNDQYLNYMEYFAQTDPNDPDSFSSGYYQKYDDMGRLIRVTHMIEGEIDYEVNYEYDNTGNRISKVITN